MRGGEAAREGDDYEGGKEERVSLVGRVIDYSCFRQMDRLKARYWRADSEIGGKTCISFTYNIFSLFFDPNVCFRFLRGFIEL